RRRSHPPLPLPRPTRCLPFCTHRSSLSRNTQTMRTLLLGMYGQSVANLICQPTCDVLWNDSVSRVPLDRIRFYRDRHGILIRSANFLKSIDVNLTDSFKFPLGRFLQVAAENIPMILERNEGKTAYQSVC